MDFRFLPLRTIRRFIQLEASSGIILFAMAILAMAIDNSPLSYYYHLLFNLKVTIGIGSHFLSKQLVVWINDGFMTIFFLLVGMEIKREMLEGELNTFSKAILPGIAAAGGMLVPVLIYLGFNWDHPVTLHGWAIPAATDIAFSLGILSLVGSRVPQSLKLFLLALAIFDDIGAIVIIAIFYSKKISLLLLICALILLSILFIFNRLNITQRAPYILVGIVLWLCMFKSGVHATLSGILLAFTIPLRDREYPQHSPLMAFEKSLHPWVAYFILPLFALANAGVSFSDVTWQDFSGSVPIGIALGLFLGKQIGIFGATMLAVRMGLVSMPRGATMLSLYGVSLIAGVGFTMSLFIGSFAFVQFGLPYAAPIRIGVIGGSLLSGIFGYLVLRLSLRKKIQRKANIYANSISY